MRLLRVLAAAAIGAGAIVAAGALGVRTYVDGSVADYEGEIAVSGLAAPVEIGFDSMGVPHVWAETDADMTFALGWLHASERLFQMELVRRLASGDLAEVFGPEAFPTDAAQRRMGFRRKALADAPSLSDSARTVVERYVAGINAWIAVRDEENRLPPEFALLRFTPAPWTVEDVVTVALYQTWYAHDLSDQDGSYDRLARRLGPEAARALRSGFPRSTPTVSDDFARETFGAGPAPMRMASASNSWAVAPARSASGAALHASDPHLSIDAAPGFWYAVALHSAEGTDLVGVTTPGLPSLAMGHNGHIAWSFTVAAIDVADFYREQRHQTDSTRVADAEGWVSTRAIDEAIRVKGEENPRVVRVEVAPRGPIVEYDSLGPVSMHWAGFDLPANAILENGLRLHGARTFGQFRRAVTGLGALDVNWVFSSRDGHIGYQLGSPIPIRTDTLPAFTLRDAAAGPSWSGYRPLSETPYALDPPTGWVASCNNRPGGPNWPYELPGFFDPYRIERAAALLSGPGPFTAGDMERFQMDIASELARRWKDLAAAGARRSGHDEVAAALREWDGTMDARDTLATVFSLWWHGLGRSLFEDELGVAGAVRVMDLQEAVLSDSITSLIDDRRTPSVEDAIDISGRAIRLALVSAAGRPWGDAQSLTVRHPLARVTAIDRALHLTRGPLAWEGDAATLSASFAILDRSTSTFAVATGPSMRYVMDWADPDSFTLTPALGQSGHPLSPHFADFLEWSRTGRRWTVPLTRGAADARRATLLRLLPG